MGVVWLTRLYKLTVELKGYTYCEYGTNFFHLQVENLMDFGLVSGEYKMVFVVRNDLKMGKGKVAAQVGVPTVDDDNWWFIYLQIFPFSVWTCSHWCL